MPLDPDTQALAGSYDSLPYGFLAIPIAHPSRLAATGVRHGIDVVPVPRSRVLEVGCAQGGHLLNMAHDYPEASFVGVELSDLQVDLARGHVRRLGLGNVEIVRGDISEVAAQLGTFDYIVCHGVYSWVPAHVRDAITATCQDHLSANGLAMVSYNTYPGWHITDELRKVVLHHVADLSRLEDRVAATRELFTTINDRIDQRNPYSALVRQAISGAFSGGDSYIAHELLEVVNHPCYLHEFVEHAHRHGLRYLDDVAAIGAPAFVTTDGDAPRGLDDVREQHLHDVVNGTEFRAAVLCHAEVPVAARRDPAALRSLHMTAAVSAEGPVEVGDSSMATFATRPGRHLSTPVPTMKSVLLTLSERWPSTVPVQELLTEPEFDDDVLRELEEMYSREIAWFTTEPIVHAQRLDERPVVASITRLCAELRERTVNRHYESVPLDELSRFVVGMLDGTHTADDVIASASAAASEGRLTITDPEGNPVTEPTALAHAAAERVADVLQALMQFGLLQA